MLEVWGRDHFRSPHRARTGSDAPRGALQTPKRVDDHFQASPASRADGDECQEESRRFNIGVGNDHGDHGLFNGEAAEAHQFRERRHASVCPQEITCIPGTYAGGGCDHVGTGLDRIGLFELDPGIVRPVIQAPVGNVQGPIEPRSDTPGDPAAPEGRGMRSREPLGDVGRTQDGHDRTFHPCTFRELHIGKKSNGFSMPCRVDKGLSHPSKKCDDLPHRIPAFHRRLKEGDAHVRWSGPTLPSRASGATSHGISASRIPPSNSDALGIRPLQSSNSGCSQRSGSQDRQTTTSLLYVANSGGTQRVDFDRRKFLTFVTGVTSKTVICTNSYFGDVPDDARDVTCTNSHSWWGRPGCC